MYFHWLKWFLIFERDQMQSLLSFTSTFLQLPGHQALAPERDSPISHQPRASDVCLNSVPPVLKVVVSIGSEVIGDFFKRFTQQAYTPIYCVKNSRLLWQERTKSSNVDLKPKQYLALRGSVDLRGGRVDQYFSVGLFTYAFISKTKQIYSVQLL